MGIYLMARRVETHASVHRSIGKIRLDLNPVPEEIWLLFAAMVSVAYYCGLDRQMALAKQESREAEVIEATPLEAGAP
jgi:hypothetical protein